MQTISPSYTALDKNQILLSSVDQDPHLFRHAMHLINIPTRPHRILRFKIQSIQKQRENGTLP